MAEEVISSCLFVDAWRIPGRPHNACAGTTLARMVDVTRGWLINLPGHQPPSINHLLFSITTMSGNEIFKPHNVAAWALKEKQRPLVVDSAPYTLPPKNHVVVKVKDVAINPIDWIVQSDAAFELNYPNVFGLDVAGEIVEVGKGVEEFKIGQRVIAFALLLHPLLLLG